MKFISTRDSKTTVDFEKAILQCLPSDGGLYVPQESADLRRWLLYTDSSTSFSSIAGTLTSACINDEFSPIICETIASKAFPFAPELKKIDERLYTLKLYNTPTGSHKDYGINYLVNCIETIHTLNGGFSTFLDATVGELGASLAVSLRGKKHIKAVLIYPQGMVRGLEESDCIWNGGNILPVEIAGTEEDCHSLVRQLFADRALVEKYHLTVANTANIGRLMPQMFFYPYAFSRLKKEVNGGIFYAMAPGNYSNLVAGLYSWKLSLPVNGFICPATDSLKLDSMGLCTVPLSQHAPADPASPDNLERLENIFSSQSLMLKHFIYPAVTDEQSVNEACRQLYKKYNILSDKNTAAAYSAVLKRQELLAEDDATCVLVLRDDPSLSSQYIKNTLNVTPEVTESIAAALKPFTLKKPPVTEASQIIELMNLL